VTAAFANDVQAKRIENVLPSFEVVELTIFKLVAHDCGGSKYDSLALCAGQSRLLTFSSAGTTSTAKYGVVSMFFNVEYFAPGTTVVAVKSKRTK
jgi:hypothetical protein